MPYDVRGVLFDLDDTLLDHSAAAAAAIWRLVQEVPGWTDDEAGTTRRWYELETEHFARYAAGEISMVEQRRARIRAFLDLEDATDDELDARFGHYLALYREGWQPLPGGPELVVRLLDEGYRVGILTNGQSAQQRAKLAAIGLTDPRLVVCISEDLPAAKPAPAAYAAACRALGLPPDQVLMVGDHRTNDVDGARAAGLRAVHVSAEPASDADDLVERIVSVVDLHLSPAPAPAPAPADDAAPCPEDSELAAERSPRPPQGPVRPARTEIGLVAAGGTVGTAFRYGLTLVMPPVQGVPVAILTVNVVGAFLLGVLLEALAELGDDHGPSRRLRLGLGTGVLGGFTTYSTLATDTVSLGLDRPVTALAYGTGTVIIGAAASVAGIAVARHRLRPRIAARRDRP